MSDGYEPIRRALAHIEGNLDDPALNLAEIAREACLSPWHFHRVFTGTVGETPITYVRKRRLSEGAKKLKRETSTVLDIALACGFDSQAAFTRAFRAHYGVPPVTFRRDVHLTINRVYEPIDAANLRPRGAVMEPKMIEKPAFTVVGLAKEFTPETAKEIPQLWTEFGPRIGSIPGQKGFHCFGMCVEAEKVVDGQPCFTYAACVEVGQDAEAPDGLAKFQVPAARYAVFTFDDHISRISGFIDRIFGEWFPATGLTRATGPDFEYYDHRWNPQTGTGEVDYYIPVELLQDA